MIRILSLLVLSIFSALSLAPANAAEPAKPAAPQLADTAPSRYVVVPGDTLWDISARFLQEPWRWPEIWRMNQAEIKNPHRIYPGDVVVLDHDASGKPYLRLDAKSGDSRQRSRIAGQIAGDSRQSPQIHEERLSDIIPPIPPNVIEPFIATPLFVEQNTLQSAPRIVATQEDRVFLGNGDTAYVEGADPTQDKWQVFRNGKPLYDPEFPSRVLGYEVFHLGSATQVRPGNPGVFEIDVAKQEIVSGDRLVPTTRPELTDYVPHAPEQTIDGRVVSVYGGIDVGGKLSIISINRGSASGLEIGHVLALERNRVVEQRDEDDRRRSIVIPALRFGLIFVFRIFDNVSYALVVQADGLVRVNDFVRTP
ncbi:MAG: LysM peptidoglycan-binding domain-containing protein [Candidatus Accumulibacter sp.]|jgi:hypothetical protein|nr:LysM peptidoglycan-binding domain-containing protein [Accumulibacter sp.]